MDFGSQFGEYLREKRTAAGLSLRQVARQIPMSHVYLTEIEHGRRRPLAATYWESLARAIPGVTERDLFRVYLESMPAKIELPIGHPDQDLVLRLAEIIRKQGKLSPAQRIGIMNILSGTSGRPPICLNNNQIWSISNALLHYMAHHIRALETDEDEQSRHDRKLAIDACISAQAAMETSGDHHDPR